jgi:tetratricopeptide (TPR) repeat protein
MKAESRLFQDRLDEAQNAVIRALAQRPRHTGTLRLAAEIAIRAGRGDRAVRWLRQAERVRPRCDDIKRELVLALLRTDRPVEATQTLDRMTAPPLALRSAALRAQGRVRDALDLIERARRAAPSVANDDEVRGEEIRLLEESGFIDRLRETLDLVDADPLAGPTVRILAGRAWLRLGAYRRVVRLAARLRRSGPAQREVLGQLTIAAWMLGRTRLARRALLRLQRTSRGVDPVLMTALWRRALHGGVLRDQGDPRRAGADRQVSLLQPLVETAARTLERTPHRGPALQEHSARCAALLRGGS